MTTLYQDFTNDLIAARQTARLIEVQKKHIEQLKKENEIFSEFETYRKIYDAELSNYNLTNVIVIDANAGEKAQILNAIYHLISSSLKAKKTIDSLLKLVVSFSTMGLADLVAENVTSQISDLIDTVVDKFSEDISEKSVSMALDKVEDVSNNIADLANKRHQLGSELYLSNEAQKCLLELASNISQEHTPHQAIQFTMKLITSLGLDAPKLIVINNPYHLDSASLSLCSLLFSYAKDLNQKSESSNISVVFNYTDRQPYDMSPIAQSADKDDSTRYTTLTRLRHMVQRYGMLEKPGSNIPKPAIKASTFVGRKEELEQLSQSYFDFVKECKEKTKGNKESLWTMIKGEPGTGKTALINKHIENITNPKDSLLSSQIRLRLLNQIGHNSEVTGLASLLQSIQSEAIRLTHYYQTNQNFVVQAINDKKIVIKNAKNDAKHAVGGGYNSKKSTIKNAVKFIADCAGFSTMHDATSSAFDALTLDKSQFQTMNALDADNKEDKKKEQFEQLNIALMHLSNISEAVNPEAKAVPLLLFIDDLQWIDELSAEYILNQLLPKFSVQLLMTARKSDSETSFKLAKNHEHLSPYKLKLFEIANLFSAPSSQKTQSKDSSTELNNIKLTEQLNLRGMDKTTLASLISTIYQNTTQYSAETIASALIEALTEEQITEQTQVITLFAVEALNVISDDAFYHRNADVARLIIQNEKGMFRVNTETEQSLSHIVDRVFKLLREAHQDAFNHDSFQNETTRNFTLSSYAVMEERLFIIHQYFAEYGDAATFSLQLGALIGAPFDSGLVSELITKLSSVDISKYPTMSPIKIYLNQQSGQTLTSEHLEILDEVFEILRRLQQGQNMHQYRHGLFAIFLRQQAKYSLDNIFQYRQNSHAFNAFIEFSQDVIIERIDKFIVNAQPTKTQFEVQLYLMNSLNHLLEFAYGIDARYWVKDYSSMLLKLAKDFVKVGDTDNAINIGEQVLTICYEQYRNTPNQFDENYSISLVNLAHVYRIVGQTDHAIRLNKKALTILSIQFEESPYRWCDRYLPILIELACCFSDTLQMNAAISIYEELLNKLKPLYEEYPKRWIKSYGCTVNNLALSYTEVHRIEEAIKLNEELLIIREALFNQNDELWVEEYCCSLINLAHNFKQVNRIVDAANLEEKAVNILNEYHQQNSNRWDKLYSKSLMAIANSLETINKVDEANNFKEKARLILKERYEKNPHLWAYDYVICLKEIAISYSETGRIQDAIIVIKQALAILEVLQSNNPKRWERILSKCLIDLASYYDDVGRTEDAINYGEKALFLIEAIYAKNPDLHIGGYNSLLNNLSLTYDKVGRRDEAIKLSEKALINIKSHYDKNPKYWAKNHSNTLNNHALFCYKSGRTDKAINLFQQALTIRKMHNDESPNSWAKEYSLSLRNLALAYQAQGRVSDFNELWEQRILIQKVNYAENPERWIEEYSESLKTLANAYQAQGRVSDSNELWEQELLIQKARYTENPERWVESYSKGLTELATKFEQAGRLEDAISLWEKEIAVLKEFFSQSSFLMSKSYCNSLNNLVCKYLQVERLADAIVIGEQSLIVLADFYVQNPASVAEIYSVSLNNLAYCYLQVGRTEDAVIMGKRALCVLEVLYVQNPTRWTENYYSLSKNLASSYKKAGFLNEAIKLKEQALNILKADYKVNIDRSDHWVENYATQMIDLSLSYKNAGYIEKAIHTEQQAIIILEELYLKSSQH